MRINQGLGKSTLLVGVNAPMKVLKLAWLPLVKMTDFLSDFRQSKIENDGDHMVQRIECKLVT